MHVIGKSEIRLASGSVWFSCSTMDLVSFCLLALPWAGLAFLLMPNAKNPGVPIAPSKSREDTNTPRDLPEEQGKFLPGNYQQNFPQATPESISAALISLYENHFPQTYSTRRSWFSTKHTDRGVQSLNKNKVITILPKIERIGVREIITMLIDF